MPSAWTIPNLALSPARLTVIFACGIIIVAGMQAASSIIVPFLSAAFLAVLSLPIVDWMAETGCPGLAEPGLCSRCPAGGPRVDRSAS